MSEATDDSRRDGQRAEISIGIIGFGYWGKKLVRVFGRAPGLRVVAICDHERERRTDAARTAEEQVHVSDDAAAVCEDPAVGAVAIATPPSSHFELARIALRAGKPCWVEKPLAMRAADARELVDLAHSQAVALFVDETFLYDPLVRRARDWIAAGRLGRLYHLSFERLGMGRIRRDSNVWWNSAPHDLAMLRYLVPREIEAIQLDQFSYLQPGISDIAVATARLSGGVSAHIYLSWLSPVKAASFVAVGSGGMLQFEGRFDQRRLTFFEYTVGNSDVVRENVVPISRFEASEVITGGSEEPLALAAEAFAELIQSGTPAPSAGEYSVQVVRLLEAAEDRRFVPAADSDAVHQTVTTGQPWSQKG